jgi:hypothetical protein
MNSEGRVARNFRYYFPGFTLVECRKVLLQGHQVTADLVIRERGSLRPIEGFVLRAIHSGLNSAEGVARFLGLDDDYCADVAFDLELQGLLNIRIVSGNTVFVLTDQGIRFLDEEHLTVQKKRQLTFPFDRLTWLPSPIDFDRERNLDLNGITCRVRPLKQTRVIAKELNPVDVERALEGWQATNSRGWGVVSVSKVVKRSKSFYPAHLLIFVESNSSEPDVRIAIAIDETISLEHTELINRNGGLAWLGLSLGQESLEIPERFSNLTEIIGEQQASHGDVALLQTIELRDQFFNSLISAKKRLVVVSAFLRRSVVDSEFHALLEAVAKRGVVVHIGYGMPNSSERDIHPEAEAILADLAGKYPNVHVARLDNTHEKFLLCDDQMTASGFNYLSYSAEDSFIRREVGITCPVSVIQLGESFVADAIKMIEAKPLALSTPMPPLKVRKSESTKADGNSIQIRAEKKILIDELVKLVRSKPGVRQAELGTLANSPKLKNKTPTRGLNYWGYSKLGKFLEAEFPDVFDIQEDPIHANIPCVFLREVQDDLTMNSAK